MSKEAKREPKERNGSSQEPVAGSQEKQKDGIAGLPPRRLPATGYRLPGAAVDAAAEQHKRLEAAELNRVLAAKLCTACATIGCWEVYNRERGPDGAGGRVRYVKCRGCGHCAQAPVVVGKQQ